MLYEDYNEFINLVMETSNSSFQIGYSVRSSKHTINFNNISKDFKTVHIEDSDITVLIRKAKEFILKYREKHSDPRRKFIIPNHIK